MSKEKFTISKDNTDFTVELRKKVKDYFKDNNLSKYGNSSIILKSIFMGLLYIAPYILIMLGIFTSVYLVLLC